MTFWRPWEPMNLPPYVQRLHEQAIAARLAYEEELERQDTLPQLAAIAAIHPLCEWLSKAERNRLGFLRWLMDRRIVSEYYSDSV